MQLLELAALHRTWLSQKQGIVADNIANANTAGFVARKPVAFAQALQDATAADMSAAAAAGGQSGGRVVPSEADENEAVTHSGNTVDVERELLDAGETKAAYALNVSVVKTFYRMLQAGTKG